MIFLIDLGNTYLKWAELRNGVLEESARENIRDNDLAYILDKSWSVLKKPERILVSSVASSKQYNQFVGWVENFWHIKPERVVPTSSAYGIKTCYSDPEILGSDRWLAIIAAHQHYQGDVCVIDCGTAITADILMADGQHAGGYIVPGLYMMMQTLLNETASISINISTQQDKFITQPGTSTDECVQHGAILSVLGFIEKIHSNIESQFDRQFTYLLTGGDAQHLIPHLSISMSVNHKPLLILEGLAVVASKEWVA